MTSANSLRYFPDSEPNGPKVFRNKHRLCEALKIPTPDHVMAPKATWQEIPDAISGIDAAKSHPFLNWKSNEFDAVVSWIGRSTKKYMGNNVPDSLGTRSHQKISCGGRCHLIDKDGWVHFNRPLPGLLHELLADTTPSEARTKVQQVSKGKSCASEDPDIVEQLWISFRKSRGII